jgi:hypothetical protein
VSSEQSISGLSSSSPLTASSATGFNKRKILKFVDHLQSDVNTILAQIPAFAAKQSEVAANQSEVLSQLRLLTDLVVGQQAGLNDLKQELANTRMEVNVSKRNSPYTEREQHLRDRLTQSRKDKNGMNQQLHRQAIKLRERKQFGPFWGRSEIFHDPAASRGGEVVNEL